MTDLPPRKQGWRNWIGDNIFSVAIFLIVVFVLAVLAYGLLSGAAGILDKLSRTETARGLITFIFTFGVVSLAFVLILTLFFSKSPDILDRFEKAKEVYTSLIVILGTIMGFYFGVEVGTQQTETVVDALSNKTTSLEVAPQPDGNVPTSKNEEALPNLEGDTGAELNSDPIIE